jgi:hypothetical protein
LPGKKYVHQSGAQTKNLAKTIYWSNNVAQKDLNLSGKKCVPATYFICVLFSRRINIFQYPDSHSPKKLNPNPHKIETDPKH